jgi:hypothetical protein
VQPGEKGVIEVEYDPAGRPGYFNKSISVTTDWDGEEIHLQIKGNVTPAEWDKNKFSVAGGILFFESASFNLGNAFINLGPTEKSFPVFNKGTEPVFIQKIIAPPYIDVTAPNRIEGSTSASIKILFNAVRRNAYGFVSENIELHTSDVRHPVISIPVYVTITEYFPELSNAETLLAPTISIDSSVVDLGIIQMGDTTSYEIEIGNSGKKLLNVRAIQSNCFCLQAQLTHNDIEQGKVETIKLRFKPMRVGTQQKAVTIYSNDPLKSVFRITIIAVVEE